MLDADYEQAAISDIRYNALLRPDRTPSLLAGRLLVVIDTRLPKDAPPTAASRPPDWPDPDAALPGADPAKAKMPASLEDKEGAGSPAPLPSALRSAKLG